MKPKNIYQLIIEYKALSHLNVQCKHSEMPNVLILKTVKKVTEERNMDQNNKCEMTVELNNTFYLFKLKKLPEQILVGPL